MSTTQALFSLVYVLLLVHVLLSAYAAWSPDTVYRIVSDPDRSFAAWAFLFALRTSRGDTENDILQSGLQPSIGIANMQRRAYVTLLTSLGGFAVLAVLFGLPGLHGLYPSPFSQR